MNKRTAAAALIATAALTLIGCGAATESSSTTTTTIQKNTTTTQSKYDRQLSAYLDEMSDRFPYSSEAELVSLGENACNVVDAFGSVASAFVAIAEDPDWTVEMAGDAGYTFGVAIPVFCPEYLSELNRIVR
jgi:hypothetical protein